MRMTCEVVLFPCRVRADRRVCAILARENIMRLLRAFWADSEAATAVEYALLAALVSMAAITAMGTLGNALSATFLAVANDMSNSSDGSI